MWYFVEITQTTLIANYSGPRKGPPSLVVFDTNARKFVREIPLPLRENEEGVLKFGWLIDDLSTGRASIALVTEQSQYGQKRVSRSCADMHLQIHLYSAPLLVGANNTRRHESARFTRAAFRTSKVNTMKRSLKTRYSCQLAMTT